METNGDQTNKDTKSIDMPDTFAEAERFQRLFVMPMVDAIRVEVRNHLGPIIESNKVITAEQAAQAARLTNLEGSQKKALVGYGVFAAGLSVALAAAWDYVKGVFK